jgi:hypothetical protein
MQSFVKSGFNRILQRLQIPPVDDEAEDLTRLLYDTLTELQRSEICFDWNHHEPERGQLRRFIANHWQVTRPAIADQFFSLKQKTIIRAIFRRLLDPAWHDAFVKQLSDDTKGHVWGADQSVAFFGNPRSEPWLFVITGRHLTLRVGSPQSQAFGGPVLYAHAATGYWEQAGHPGNIFWPQAKAASRLYAVLDKSQQIMAEVDTLPEECAIGFDVTPAGLPARLLSPPQMAELDSLLRCLMAPFRSSDRVRILECLEHQGGLSVLNIAFARSNRISAPEWDDWRLQGPSFVWHWRGFPHVHVWVNVGTDPAEPVNARSGAFIFPNHDPLL